MDWVCGYEVAHTHIPTGCIPTGSKQKCHRKQTITVLYARISPWTYPLHTREKKATGYEISKHKQRINPVIPTYPVNFAFCAYIFSAGRAGNTAPPLTVSVMRYQPKQPLTVKPWPFPAHFLLGFVQFAVRFLPDYIASY